MRTKNFIHFALLAAATGTAACGGNDSSGTFPPDASTDVSTDASTNVSVDGPTEASTDTARPDTAASDTGPANVGADGGNSSTADARGDAVAVDSAVPDAGAGNEGGGTDAGHDAGSTVASPDAGSVEAGVDSAAAAPGIVGLPGYTVTVFTTGGTTYLHPDSLELDGTHVWVGYNMGVPSKDGSDAGAPYNSNVVEYNLDGSPAGKSFSIPGHCDGVRVDPSTHIVWATSNEDGNPILMSYNPATALATTYTLTNQPGHGGGLDDLAFFGGRLIVADSNPSPDDAGAFRAATLSVVHVSGATASFTPFLLGTAMAHDVYAGADVAVNASDPDSISIDDKGNLVLVDQGDSKLFVIQTAGGAHDGGADAGADGGPLTVSAYTVATQLDDTVWATSATGMLLVADEKANTIYAVHATFTPGTVYTVTPDDSSIPGILGTVNLGGLPQPGPTFAPVSPVVLGFKKPTGLIFVAQ